MGIFSFILSKLALKKNVSGYFGFYSRSSPFTGEIWENDTVRAIIDTIATHAAKGKIQHVVTNKDGRIIKRIYDSKIAYLLNEKPNSVMSGFELKYRFFSQLYTKTTAVLYIRYENGEAKAIYPVDYTRYEFREIQGGGWAIEFTDQEGTVRALPVSECVIVRRFFSNNQVSGDGNTPLYKVLDMNKAADEGTIEALNVSNKVRGLLKQKKAMLDPADIKKSQDEFATRFEEAAKHGGVVTVDSTEEYTPLSANTYTINSAQSQGINARYYNYFRTPEAIVQSCYSENVGLAWTESVIEPLWEALTEALSNSYFTQREHGCGNKFIITAGILMGTSYQTRLNIISNTKEIGIFTINEQRDLLGYPPVEGGDVRQVSLNFVNADNQDEYQDVGENTEVAPVQQEEDTNNPTEEEETEENEQ